MKRHECKISPNLLWVAVLIAVQSSFSEYSPNLRHDPNLDALILRICSIHGLRVPRALFAQPMRSADLKMFFASADSLAAIGRLSDQEKWQLAHARPRIFGDKAVATWKKGSTQGAVHVGLLGAVTPRLSADERSGVRVRGTLRPDLTASVGAFSCFSDVAVSTDYYSDTLFKRSSYQPFTGMAYNLYNRADSSHIRSTDILRGGISYAAANLDLEVAIDHLRQGPTIFNQLAFSGEAPPETYFRGRLDLGLLDYVQTFGQLRAQKDKQKFFYTHRITIPLLKDRLQIGIYETVVNGSTAQLAQADSLRGDYYGVERTWEWVYMIPFVPYSFAEHYLGDRDNKFIGFDLNLMFPHGWRWYGEFLLDDILSPWSIFGSDFGNKWALTAGMQYFGSFLSRDVSAGIEYCRVEPWVYTHFYGGSHSYAHFGQSLGAPLGPNSDALRMSVGASITTRYSLALTLDRYRKNSVTRGGDITDVFLDSTDVVDGVQWSRSFHDSKIKRFLGPGTTTSTEVGLCSTIMPFETFRLIAQIAAGFQNGAVYGVIRMNGGLEF